ncbi:MAG: NUDIX hydrolase, partial [Armatimonadota bacterium]
MPASRFRPSHMTPQAQHGTGRRPRVIAAGGVVYRRHGDEVEVVLVRKSATGRWRLPKGHLREGESLEEAAVREAYEEAGLRAEVEGKIGQSSYTYWDEEAGQERGKTVHHFLLRALPGREPEPEAGVFDRAEFLAPEEAAERVAFDNEREAIL